MRAYLDCPGCSCLVGVGESACPFCGHVLRSVVASHWLALGLALTLGAASVSCGDKGDGNDDDTVTASESHTSQGPASNGDVSDTVTASGVTYAGPDETASSDPFPATTSGDPTVPDPTNAEGSTYAGPDETTSTDGSSSGSSDSSGSTTEESTGSTTAETDTGTGSSGSTG